MTTRRRLPWLMWVSAMLLLSLDLWLGVLNHRLDEDVLVNALFIAIIVGTPRWARCSPPATRAMRSGGSCWR
jgi:hypothetical protein